MNSLRQSGRLLLKEREWLLEKERVAVSALHVQEHEDLDVVTAARDDNGDVVGLSAGGETALQIVHKRSAMMMSPSALDAIATTSTSSFVERWVSKAPFSRVRFHLFNADTTAASGTYRMLAAVSEKAPDTPATDIWQPIVGGANQTALRADVGSPGWAKVLFSTAETVALDQSASEFDLEMVSSDWLDLASIPRTDGDGYVLLLRYECLAGARSTELGLVTATLPKKGYDVALTNGKQWYEQHNAYVKSGASCVTDLTLLGSETRNTICLAVAVELEYDVPAVSILAHGDSLTAMNDGDIALYEFSSWIARAVMWASSESKIYRAVLIAEGGATYSEYSVTGYTALTQLTPDIFMHPVWSPNDGVPDATTMGIALANLNTAIKNAAAVGARVLAWGPLPNDNYDATADAYRLALIARVKAMAESTAAFDYFDCSFMSDGATPERFISGLNTDATHPNETGTQLMAERFKDWLLVNK